MQNKLQQQKLKMLQKAANDQAYEAWHNATVNLYRELANSGIDASKYPLINQLVINNAKYIQQLANIVNALNRGSIADIEIAYKQEVNSINNKIIYDELIKQIEVINIELAQKILNIIGQNCGFGSSFTLYKEELNQLLLSNSSTQQEDLVNYLTKWCTHVIQTQYAKPNSVMKKILKVLDQNLYQKEKSRSLVEEKILKVLDDYQDGKSKSLVAKILKVLDQNLYQEEESRSLVEEKILKVLDNYQDEESKSLVAKKILRALDQNLYQKAKSKSLLVAEILEVLDDYQDEKSNSSKSLVAKKILRALDQNLYQDEESKLAMEKILKVLNQNLYQDEESKSLVVAELLKVLDNYQDEESKLAMGKILLAEEILDVLNQKGYQDEESKLAMEKILDVLKKKDYQDKEYKSAMGKILLAEEILDILERNTYNDPEYKLAIVAILKVLDQKDYQTEEYKSSLSEEYKSSLAEEILKVLDQNLYQYEEYKSSLAQELLKVLNEHSYGKFYSACRNFVIEIAEQYSNIDPKKVGGVIIGTYLPSLKSAATLEEFSALLDKYASEINTEASSIKSQKSLMIKTANNNKSIVDIKVTWSDASVVIQMPLSVYNKLDLNGFRDIYQKLMCQLREIPNQSFLAIQNEADENNPELQETNQTGQDNVYQSEI